MIAFPAPDIARMRAVRLACCAQISRTFPVARTDQISLRMSRFAAQPVLDNRGIAERDVIRRKDLLIHGSAAGEIKDVLLAN